MLLHILVLLATTASAGANLLEFSEIDGTADGGTPYSKQKAIDRDNTTFYHSAYYNNPIYRVFIHVSLTEAAIVKRVVTLSK